MVGDDRIEDNAASTSDASQPLGNQSSHPSTPDDPAEHLRQFVRDVPSDKAMQRTKLTITLTVITTVLVLGGGYWYAAVWRHLPDPDSGPPLVVPQEGPVRVKPDDPGGLDIPHQDKLVYGHLDPDGAPQETVERLLPPPEIATNVVASQEGVERTTDQIADTMPERIVAPDLPIASDVSDIPSPVLPKDSISDPQTTTEETASSPQPDASHQVDSSPDKNQPSSQEKIQEKPSVVASPEFFRIQLGAFRSDVAAQNGWKALSKEFPDILAGLKGEIIRADLGEQGIYYRVQAGQLEKEAAQEICRQLSAQKKGCLVVKR